MELDTYLSHPVDGSIPENKVINGHYCEDECINLGNKKVCLEYFYSTVPQKLVDTEIMKKYLPDWEPKLDQVEIELTKAAGNSWGQDFESAIAEIKETRNPSVETFKDVKIFTVNLKKMSDESIREEISNFLNNFDVNTGLTPEVIPLTLQGEIPADLHTTPGVPSLPGKIILGNASSCLEILIPLKASTNTVVLDTNVELSVSLSNLFRSDETKKVFLVYNATKTIYKIQAIMRSLKNGEGFYIGKFLDITLLYVRYGRYARNEISLQFLYKFLVGGVHLSLDLQEAVDSNSYFLPYGKCQKYVITNGLAELLVLLNLYRLFFIIVIPSMFPSKIEALDNVCNLPPRYFLEHVINIITEACATIDFDSTRYILAPPKLRFCCGGDESSLDLKKSINTFRVECAQFRSNLASSLQRAWPNYLYYITRENWSLTNKLDPDFVKQLCIMESPFDKPAVDEPFSHSIIRESKSLIEILNYISPDRSLAWKVLDRQLKKMPDILLRWLDNSAPIDAYDPESFKFGSFRNFSKILQIANQAYPDRVFQNPHHDLHNI